MPNRFLPLLAVLGTARERVERWSVESQQRACVNARSATAALERSRAERDDVETFLANRSTSSAGSHDRI